MRDTHFPQLDSHTQWDMVEFGDMEEALVQQGVKSRHDENKDIDVVSNGRMATMGVYYTSMFSSFDRSVIYFKPNKSYV